MRVLSSGSLTVQTCSASRGAVEAGGRRPVVPGVGPSAAEEDAFPRRCREPLLRRTLVRERAEREEGRLAQQQGAAPAGAAQRVEDRAGKGNHGGGARTRHREARAKLRRQIGLPRPPRLPRERALRGADDGDVGAGEEERVPRERLLPRRSSRHLELRAERRRRPRAPRRLLLELGEQRLALRARLARATKAVDRGAKGGRVPARARWAPLDRDHVVHVRVRAQGGRRELHRREERAEISRHAVEGTGMDDQHACRAGGVRVLELASVDELGLTAQVGVVSTRCDARPDDRLAIEAIRAGRIHEYSTPRRHRD
mmetsp:Transcript_37906/g.126832  ORF Transcript_37906/g.126832 Transcript_37906/m.126832 type:complete len:314 (-) Transcript_37906:256-1197(-)